MVESGGGSIIVVGSYAGTQGSRGQAAYASAKAGLMGLVKTAAREWGPSNIRVNLCIPDGTLRHLRAAPSLMKTPDWSCVGASVKSG